MRCPYCGGLVLKPQRKFCSAACKKRMDQINVAAERDKEKQRERTTLHEVRRGGSVDEQRPKH